MRILMAGKSDALLGTLQALHVADPDVHIVGQALDEGELFAAARAHQPELILLHWTFRPRLTPEWAAYLSAISGGARVVAVYAPSA